MDREDSGAPSVGDGGVRQFTYTEVKYSTIFASDGSIVEFREGQESYIEYLEEVAVSRQRAAEKTEKLFPREYREFRGVCSSRRGDVVYPDSRRASHET